MEDGFEEAECSLIVRLVQVFNCFRLANCLKRRTFFERLKTLVARMRPSGQNMDFPYLLDGRVYGHGSGASRSFSVAYSLLLSYLSNTRLKSAVRTCIKSERGDGCDRITSNGIDGASRVDESDVCGDRCLFLPLPLLLRFNSVLQQIFQSFGRLGI